MIVVSISANDIHSKQLAPHLRRKINGKDKAISYQETYVERKNSTLIGTAGEPLIAGKFGHFQNGVVLLADCYGDKKADCLIMTGASEGDEFEYVVDDYIVELSEPITHSPYLSTSGDVQTTLPTSGMIQIVGERIDEFSFLLKIKDPLYW